MNELEFAEKKFFDGKMIPVLEDENELIKRIMKKGQTDANFFKAQKLIFITPENLDNKKPEVNTVVQYEKKQYLITDVNYEQGIYSIAMEVHKG